MDTKQTKLPKKQNFSKKRQAILEVMRSTTCHPTAEWILEQLKPEYPNLSLGTVYRNIAQFKEDGLIIGVGSVDGHERFDATTYDHGHFFCRSCGCVLDIAEDHVSPETIAAVAEQLGVEIDGHELKFYGRCSACRKKDS